MRAELSGRGGASVRWKGLTGGRAVVRGRGRAEGAGPRRSPLLNLTLSRSASCSKSRMMARAARWWKVSLRGSGSCAPPLSRGREAPARAHFPLQMLAVPQALDHGLTQHGAWGGRPAGAGPLLQTRPGAPGRRTSPSRRQRGDGTALRAEGTSGLRSELQDRGSTPRGHYIPPRMQTLGKDSPASLLRPREPTTLLRRTRVARACPQE